MYGYNNIQAGTWLRQLAHTHSLAARTLNNPQTHSLASNFTHQQFFRFMILNFILQFFFSSSLVTPAIVTNHIEYKWGRQM